MPLKQRQIVILGYRSVGKTALSIQFVYSNFTESYNPTIENTFIKTIQINNQEYELILLDTAGLDEYSLIITQYLMNIHIYILVYSITSRKSFEIIKTIYDKILNMTGKIRIPTVLIGTKKDLAMDRVVTEVEGRNLANLLKIQFFEISAKETECVSRIFHTIIMEVEKANDDIKKNKEIICSIS